MSRGIILTDTPIGAQELLAVNEPGLYNLILGSRKPQAKALPISLKRPYCKVQRKNCGGTPSISTASGNGTRSSSIALASFSCFPVIQILNEI